MSNRLRTQAAFILALTLPVFSHAASAADHTVAQKDKAFSAKTLSIKVGDRINFKNEDNVAHNIFSLSEPMPFDVGTFNPGESKQVTFGKAGIFDVECVIHPGMKIVVTVAK